MSSVESAERSQFLRAGLKRGMTEDLATLQGELVLETPSKVNLSFGLRRLIEEEKELKAVNQVIQASLEGDELAEDCYQEGRFLKEIGLMIEAISTRFKTIDARDCPSNQSRSVTPAPSRAFPDTQESANLQIIDSWHVEEQEQEQESRAASMAARERTPSVRASSSYDDIGRQRQMEVHQERKTVASSKPSTFWREFRRPTVEARKFNERRSRMA